MNNELRVKVNPAEIAFLVQIMEGHSHVGVVTTTNPANGEVVVQVTPDTYMEARYILGNIPLKLEFCD